MPICKDCGQGYFGLKDKHICAVTDDTAVATATVMVESPVQPQGVSPVERRELYTESHPILGVTRKRWMPKDAAGDGRTGDGARTEEATHG